eukprot:232960_1
MSKRLQNKVCLITGASQGIGRGIALLFKEYGATLALLDIKPLDKTVSLMKDGSNVLCLNCDISNEEQIKSSIQKIGSRFGRIDVIVNNACHFVFHTVLTASKQNWLDSMNVNIIGSANIIKHSVNSKLIGKGGSIINMSSISAYIAQKNFTTYSICKAALLQMTKNTALDLYEKYGIRVNAICPGLTETPASKSDYNQTVERLTNDRNYKHKIPTYQEWKNEIANKVAIIKRFASTKEIAFACLFFASDDSSFCTGSSLLVDGGWSTL